MCHTIIVEKSEDGKIVYNASSPDELALVNAARKLGITLVDRNNEDNTLTIDFLGQLLTYSLLNIIEFNSNRKRMTVILRDE